MQWITAHMPTVLIAIAIPGVGLLIYLHIRESRRSLQRMAEVNTVMGAIFDNSADAMVMFDSEGRITSLNHSAEKMYGWTVAEAKGQVLPMIPESRRDRVRIRLQTPPSAESVVSFDTRHLTREGQLIELNVTWSTFLGEEGKVVGTLLVARDLTHIRHLESELMHLNDHLMSLTTVASCLSGAIEIRPTLETAVLNIMDKLKLSFCQVSSLVGDQGLLPTLQFGIVPPQFSHVVNEVVQEAEHTQRPVQHDLLLVLPIRALDRIVGSLVVVFEDEVFLDKRVRVVETFTQQLAAILYAVSLVHKERETTEKITELNRLRGDFVAVVSHELRTPLTCIKGFVDTLMRPLVVWSAEDQAEFLASISISCDQALRVVEDLLSVQQAEYGKLTIHQEPIDLVKIVEDCCRRAQSVSRNHSIRWSLPHSVVVKADTTRLNQVMDNLLSNAIKYSPLGGDVDVKLKLGEDIVEVSVTDYGVGIEPIHQPHVFEKFYRADNTAARRAEGLGLGLSIVRSIVNLHGGEIWLTSMPQKGSTFYFTLPYQG